jgi:hypothetical protein
MGRYLRWLFTLTLLLVWLAVAVFWVRSYWRGDQIVWQNQRELPIEGVSFTRRQIDQYVIISGFGGVCLGKRELQLQMLPQKQFWLTSKDPIYPKPWTGTSTAAVFVASSTVLARNNVTTLPSNTITFNTLTISPPGPSGSGTITSSTTKPSVGAWTLSGTLSGATKIEPSERADVVISSGAVSVTGSNIASNKVSSGGQVLTVSGGVTSGGGNTFRGTLTLTGNMMGLSFPPPPNPPPGAYQFCMYSAGEPTDWNGHALVLIFPYWALLPLVTVPLVLAIRWELRARRRAWRLRSGLCPDCGYDLRASPERCPECGATAPVPQVA